jgi:kinesin family protein 3/17
LETEIRDLQSEFETDREDYLETIRRQEQQLKLFTQICDKMQPLIRRDCNYANVDRIKRDAVWNERDERWIIPDVMISTDKLPTHQTGKWCMVHVSPLPVQAKSMPVVE